MEKFPQNTPEKVPQKRPEKLLSQEEAAERAQEIQDNIAYLQSLIGKELSQEEEEKKEDILGETRDDVPLAWYISSLEREHYQYATAGPEGDTHVRIQYPLGVYHEAGEFETWVQENEQAVKELYHHIGASLDKMYEDLVSEYNSDSSNEKITFDQDSPHAETWYSAQVVSEDNQDEHLKLPFGGMSFSVHKDTSGKWYAEKEGSPTHLLPASAAKKVKEIYRRGQDLLEARANELLT